MNTFEIQVFKSGIWHVDSYYDDRDSALSEAERLTELATHTSVRVLEEDYDETTCKTSCRVVYSQSLNSNKNHGRRKGGQKASKVQINGAKLCAAGATGGQAPPKGNNTSFYLGLVVGFGVLIVGVAATIGLQEFSKYL